MSNRKQSSSTNWSKALLPLIGLIAVAIAGLLAYALSTPIEEFLLNNIANLPTDGSMRIVSGIAIFVLILLIFGILYALVAPKPKTVHESKLKEEITKQRSTEKQQRQAKRQNQQQQQMRMSASTQRAAKSQNQAQRSGKNKPRPKQK